jgi:hypothetical protein
MVSTCGPYNSGGSATTLTFSQHGQELYWCGAVVVVEDFHYHFLTDHCHPPHQRSEGYEASAEFATMSNY